MSRSVFLALIVATACAQPVARDAPPADGSGARVVEIVDGDTLWVSADGLRTKVRLIGVDTPETRHPRRGIECYGRDATRALERLVSEERVRLVYDLERLDRYGRTLAYVYRARDGTFVNLEMVRSGYAQVATVPPNVAHVTEFLAAQREARAAGRGLWRACDRPGTGSGAG